MLKLHTKRSSHREDGHQWRSEMLERLSSPGRAARILAAFNADPSLGAVAPEGHVLPMRTYLSANRNAIEHLIARLGLRDQTYLGHSIMAGSMCWCRLEALRPLRDAHLDEWEFEPEEGQLDGTLAHGIERILALCVRDAGYAVETAASLLGEPDSAPAHYRYAAPGRS